MTRYLPQTELDSFELDLQKKLDQKEIDIVQAFEQYKLKRDEIEENRQRKKNAQHHRKVPSLQHFLVESYQRVQIVSMGLRVLKSVQTA